MRSPIWWFGGKGLMTAKLVPLIPPHRIYVEPFCGGASLFFAKPPSPVEVLNDFNSGLVNFFRVLRDPTQFQEFHRLAGLTPYSRKEYNDCRLSWATETDSVQRAYKWFVVARMSFGGLFANSWGFAVTQSNRGMSGVVSRWLSCIDNLPQIAARLLRVQVECDDFRHIIKTYDTPDTFFYGDPSYPQATRKQGGYAHELTDQDHLDLIELLLNIKGKAMISTYPSPLYENAVNGQWRKVDFQTACHAAGKSRASNLQGAGTALRNQPRTERVYLTWNSEEGMLW